MAYASALLLQMLAVRGGRWRGPLGRCNSVAPQPTPAPAGSVDPVGSGPGALGTDSIHRVLQPALPEQHLADEYDVLRSLGEGCFARVLLARHRATESTVVLKAVGHLTAHEGNRDGAPRAPTSIAGSWSSLTSTPVCPQVHCELTPLRDFYREYHYAYRLSPHPNVVKTFPVAFRAPQEQCLVFATEVAPLGDLMGLVRPGGLPESHVKRAAQQIASALHFMHSMGLVRTY